MPSLLVSSPAPKAHNGKEPTRQLLRANGSARGERFRITGRGSPCGDLPPFDLSIQRVYHSGI